ncbi:Methyltransferase [Fimbriiglobus ruber]|uniref:Methyltransferase n=2 Tax=Fimbriiglobus ruber TaxID=1908690 RepID=A0A225DYF1_9BACT|nr:Methyltransferase [Fimbriiglobus ruber]
MKLVKAIIPKSVRAPVRCALEIAYAKSTRSWTARSWMCDLRDAWDWVWGRHDPLTPPRKLVFGIGGGFEVGPRFVRHFRELAGLRPDEAVLDIGCGVGRMALPLTTYLSPAGRYEGFDIMRPNVGWCRGAITPRFPNFRFRHADIFNNEYNPLGKIRGREFRFPYADASFDFAFLTSVFTHMLPDEVAHYLSEIGRVLKPGGRCFATVYLLNDESNRLVEAGQSKFTLFPQEGFHRVHSQVVPEACVALDENWFDRATSAAGLSVDRPAYYGAWSGQEKWTDFQDIVVLRK